MAENFKNQESLDQVKRVLDEANAAINDPNRTIQSSSMGPELSGVVGAGAGAGLSFAALYGLGVTGLSAAGITSGLAHKKHQKLMQEKRELYNLALQKQNQLIRMLEKENRMNRERAEYLHGLVIMLKAAVRDLQADLAA